MTGLEREIEKKNHFQSRLYIIELRLVCLYVNVKLLNMTIRHELCLEEEINLITEKENGLSYRLLSERVHISTGAVSNILKRILEYTDEYESLRNKRLKENSKMNLMKVSLHTPIRRDVHLAEIQ